MKSGFGYLILLLITPCLATAGILEQGFQADYTLSRNDFSFGVAEYRLYPQTNDTLIYESTAKPEGFAAVFVRDNIIERSQIKRLADGFQPLQYEYQQRGGKETKHYQLNFDWAQQKLVNTNINTTFDLPENTQDMLSFQLQLMHTLQSGGKSLSFHLADRNKLRSYQLNFINKAKLKTIIGELEVILLEHRRPDRKDIFRFWCAPSLEYLPVRIERIEEDGDIVMFQIRSFASLPNPQTTTAQH